MKKEGRTTGLEWGGPGRVGGAPGSQASPGAPAPGRCARPCLGLWRVFPGTPGAADSDRATLERSGGLRPRRWVFKLGLGGSEFWGLHALRHGGRVASEGLRVCKSLPSGSYLVGLGESMRL